jgi:hypothetical protein
MRIPTSSLARAGQLATIAALLGACAAAGPRLEAWKAPPLGATWEMAQRNTGSFGKDTQYSVTRRDTTWQGAPAVALVNSAGVSIISEPQSGRWITVLGPGDKPLLTFDPPIGWQYPIQVGKNWTKHHRMILHSTGSTVEFDVSCRVEDFEAVTVRAGTFDAFRIHCTTTTGSDEMYWTSPELGRFVKTRLVRDGKSPFGPGTQEMELVSHTLR